MDEVQAVHFWSFEDESKLWSTTHKLLESLQRGGTVSSDIADEFVFHLRRDLKLSGSGLIEAMEAYHLLRLQGHFGEADIQQES